MHQGSLPEATQSTTFHIPSVSNLSLLVEAQTSATMHASTSVVFALGPRRCTLTVALHWPSHTSKYRSLWTFECTHLKFTVSGQSIDIHMRTQCSHASVGLAQAWPNKGCQVRILNDLKLCRFITRCNAYSVKCAIPYVIFKLFTMHTCTSKYRWCLVLTQWYNIPEQQCRDPGGHWWKWYCPALYD